MMNNNMNKKITVEYSDNLNKNDLQSVIAIGRKNKKTLGCFPDSAFEKAANLREIIVVRSQNQIIAYLLYRIRKYDNACGITHLCLSSTIRGKVDQHGQKMSDGLISFLVEKEKSRSGLFLNCREDYSNPTQMWKRNGFQEIRKFKGRSVRGTSLISWWRPLNEFPLFKYGFSEQLSEQLHAVVDSNIIFDWISSGKSDNSEHSRELLSDWLSEELKLYYTPELDQDISRSHSEKEQTKAFKQKDLLSIVPRNQIDFQIAYELLGTILAGERLQDISDKKHIAYTFAAGIPFFLTRDEILLNKADKIFEKLDESVRIIHPSDFITHIDEQQRNSDYEPVFLQGTDVEVCRVGANQTLRLYNIFKNHDEAERKTEFAKVMREALSNPDKNYSFTINSEEVESAFASLEIQESGTCQVNFLRVAKNQNSATFACQLVEEIIREAIKNKCKIIEIADPHIHSLLIRPLSNRGFLRTEKPKTLVKILCYGLVSKAELQKTILSVNSSYNIAELNKTVDQLDSFENQGDLLLGKKSAVIEQLILPGHICDVNIPTYIVPIHPEFASQLFDTKLVAEELFPRKRSLGLNVESVYYTELKREKFTPARILWYVKKSNYNGTMAIRACSWLDDMQEGYPKKLFKQFSRLGIWTWDHLKDRQNRKHVALRFSRTELFSYPVAYEKIKLILKKNGIIGCNFATIEVIPENVFETIYQLGTQSNETK